MIREYFYEHPDKIDRNLKWKSVKKNFKKDPRYEKVDSSKERESIFQNIIHELARTHREKYSICLDTDYIDYFIKGER